ncbi:sigma-70 family RNA polymerase sigma factor [Rugosimonospora acidiphila]|uniref:Sigma-70 family RNA polymerase sigma factor n=1 Tax=Rugosimonospora acidiphila TaxID=556531 RepID=A0ABP9SEB0_9ACTN
MSGNDGLAERFERERPRLRAMAYRMLGSGAEADDVVQDAWLRLIRADPGEVNNLAAWLTTVVGRICLDLLRSRASRREEPLDGGVEPRAAADPEGEAVLADSVGSALLVILDTLAPVERLAFVLHDMFAVSFEEIAPIAGRSPAATRQLASRARRRVAAGDTGPGAALADADPSRRRKIVDAFFAAARQGEFATLLALLDPDVVLRADDAAARLGGSGAVRGQEAVARFLSGRARGAVPALIDGTVGAVGRAGERIVVVLELVIIGGRIAAIEVTGDPERLAELDVTPLGE